MRQTLFACLTLLVAEAATAQEIRPQEQARLDRFERIVGTAMLEALAGDTAQDVAALTTALSGKPQVAFDPSLQGDWRCRTMKLGGLSELVVLKWSCFLGQFCGLAKMHL
ncbi:DUF4893 domain-containing protein, partial [Sulfitobacter sp.]|uniref:DUF4893 domain-containing protein n=1 Tax=Sulfitobacter sp. TaxID=1903071 RepID=UPI0030025DE7